MSEQKTIPVLLEPTKDGFNFVFADGFTIGAEHNWGPSDLLKIKNALEYAYLLGLQTETPKEEDKPKKDKKQLITEKVVKGNIKETV